MKITYPTSKKAKGSTGYCKHLRKYGKKVANKSTRRITKVKYKHTYLDCVATSNCKVTTSVCIPE